MVHHVGQKRRHGQQEREAIIDHLITLPLPLQLIDQLQPAMLNVVVDPVHLRGQRVDLLRPLRAHLLVYVVADVVEVVDHVIHSGHALLSIPEEVVPLHDFRLDADVALHFLHVFFVGAVVGHAEVLELLGGLLDCGVVDRFIHFNKILITRRLRRKILLLLI